MSQIENISSVLQIASLFEAFCIDMFGVIYDGTAFYPQALTALEHLKKQGKKIYILSNATKPAAQLEEESALKGLLKTIHYDAFLSSGSVLEKEVANGFFERLSHKKDYRFYMIGFKPHTLFADIENHLTNDMNQADFIYFGSPSSHHKIALNLNHLLPELEQALSLQKTAVLANPDYHAFQGETKYCAQGSMGKWYEEHGGKVIWIGKPFPLIYQYAEQLAATPASHMLMIGDTIRTDIVGGKNAGMKTLLITGTGITADAFRNGLDLQTLCRLEGATPDYTIERFL